MAAPRRYTYQLRASKSEARLAVDLHNRVGTERQLEAFIVHMSLAWLKLLQAFYEKDGRKKQTFKLDKNGHRQRTAEGDWLMKPLQALLEESYSPTDPVRVNVEFFLGLRHKIEHRHDRDVAVLVAGKTQAIVLNYERELVRMFGENEGLADELRFPVFVSSVTEDGLAAVKEVRARAPRSVLDYIQDFDAALDPEVSADHAYEFRVVLIPQTGPKSEADVAMTFVRLEELEEAQRETVETALTVIREKQVPVANLGQLLPKAIVPRVEASLDSRFTTADHTRCWKHYRVRPESGAPHPERTKPEFCRWDHVFKRYTYTEAWVAYLERKLADKTEYQRVLGRSSDTR